MKLIKKKLFIILSVVVFFTLTYSVDFSITYAATSYGSCTTAQGYKGTCYDRTKTACATYYDSGNYCPGGASIQCCITTPSVVHCKSPYSLSDCHNSSGYNKFNCTGIGGTFNSGSYCSGPSDVQCCVRPTPTRTPTPTATPTPDPGGTIGSTTTPGIIFTGNGTADFGLGQPSSTGWVVGGATNSEVFSQSANPSSISYQRLFDKANQAKLTVIDMTTISGCSDLANCTLPAGLAHGIYSANGNVNLNAVSFLANNDYVFLINGDLKVLGNIVSPPSSFVMFAASNDIIINRTVGAATNSYPLPNSQIQAIFSAGRNFIVDGIGKCGTGTDKMLNAEGAIVANAGLGLTGTFKNFRDLCSFNATIPAFTIKPRLDFLLNAPEFIMTTSTVFREAL